MRKFANVDLFDQSLKSPEFRDWVVVDIKPKTEGLLVVLANPFDQKTQKIVIDDIEGRIEELKDLSRKRLYNDFPRFVSSFRPGETAAFTEYESWDDFASSWLERDGKPVNHLNIPLLIDHTPLEEYNARDLAGETILAHQRLLVTTYFANKNRFFDFFIKDIDDNEAGRIAKLVQARIGINIDSFFQKA